MGDLKPLGSEKLNGDAKLQRILELTYFNQPKKTIVNNKAEMIKESVSGGLYGIVKEKDGYYVKKGLTENTLDYIGGLFMKNKNKFSSYSEALKRMDLLSGQEKLQEATKYVLKQNTPPPAQETPVAAPSIDTTSAPNDMPAVDTTTPTNNSGEGVNDGVSDGVSDGGEESAESKRSDYMAEIQKFAGKLGQELRDQHQRLESDDIKYVLNMIISAVDLDKLDEKDIKDIGKKFERDEDSMGDGMGDEPTEPEIPEPSAEPAPDDNEELGETLSKLNSFINSPAYEEETDEVDLSKYADLGDVDEMDMSSDEIPHNDEYLDEDDLYENLDQPNGQSNQNSVEDEIREIDMDEIKNEINKRIGETLGKYFK